jgi:hypothetical protein
VDYNLRAIRAYQKCGLAIEGREREAAFVDGIWHDDLMMAILDREYAEIQRSQLRLLIEWATFGRFLDALLLVSSSYRS